MNSLLRSEWSSRPSHQLRLLRHLGLVTAQRVGRRMIYAPHDSHVGILLAEAVYHVEHLRLGYSEPITPIERLTS